MLYSKSSRVYSMISVSRTNLPSLKLYNSYLRRIWHSNWLTNNGELVQELEKKIQERLKVKNVVCTANGTLALMIAIRAMGLKGKFYTSPISFIATVSGPVWEGLKPVFVDLDEKYTKGPVISTHTYGVPHLVEGVRPVIYDASHAFIVKHKGRSILSYGDVSIVSFNAVKIFQTVEGGALVTNNDNLAKKARWMRNFGFKTRYSFWGTGINAKMSEFHAAMGLCMLQNLDKMIKRYDQICDVYNKNFGYDYHDVIYYPLYYSSEKKVVAAIKEFEKNDIFPRRYFYPPLNKVFGGKKCPLAEKKSRTVLALPLYHELTNKQIDLVVKIAKKTL